MSDISLTIIVTVVGGAELVQRCLGALSPQVDFADNEIIVPYDRWSMDVGALSADFPSVGFHFISNLEAAASETVAAHTHRLYDRRRAVGLSLARGRIIAMTEDYAVPAPDWCQQILHAHEKPYAVIGGAIENAVDRPLNMALFYCDFGRYGRPFKAGEAEYASDVNVSYKRKALEPVSDVWRVAYHETTLHWLLSSRGEAIRLDPSIVVFEHRPVISLRQAVQERIEWGRVFAETRVAASSTLKRICYAAATPFLPGLLLIRALRHMFRQRRPLKKIAQALPLAGVLLMGWAYGELLGYLIGQIEEEGLLPEGVPET